MEDNPVAIRVIVNRKPKYSYIDWIYEKDWNKEQGKVKSSHPNSKRLNNLIQKKLVEADDMILEAESLNKNYTSGEIKEGIKSNSSKTSFFKMANGIFLIYLRLVNTIEQVQNKVC